MIVKLFNKDMSYLQSFDSCQELIITEELGTGYKTIKFLVPYNIGNIQEEQKIEVDSYLYVIKEVNMSQRGYYEVYGKPYFGILLNKKIDSLTGYNMVLDDCLRQIFDETDWTYVIKDYVAGSFTVNIQNKTALEALAAIKSLYQFNYNFDTKNKVVSIWKTYKSDTYLFVLDSENLRSCSCQSNSYDLVTRLIPIGKDNTMITLVNGNCSWVEDFSYTDEIIVGYWISSNANTKNANDLLTLAQAKIADISHPKTSYKIQLTQLDSNIKLGDTLHIIDKIKGIDSQQQVQKIVKYTNNIDKSYLEAGTLLTSFDDIYKDFKEAQKNVNEDTLQNLAELNLS